MNILQNLFKNFKKEDLKVDSSIVGFNPFIYFSAGESLNDKDRDFNIDLIAIQKFFQPIDNLFGDYEVKKSYGLEKTIFTKSVFEINEAKQLPYLEKDLSNINALEHNDALKEFQFCIKCDKNGILKNISDKNAIIYFVIFFNRSSYSIQLDAFVSNSNEIELESKSNFINLLNKKVSEKNLSIVQIFAVDPIKLIQIVDLDPARIEHFKHNMARSENIGIDTINKFLEAAKKVRLETENSHDSKYFFNINNFETYQKIITELGLDVANLNGNEDIIKVLDLFSIRAYKLKNFEEHEHFKARIGYENGHFVLFLHPYKSETNNPIRFPPGGQ